MADEILSRVNRIASHALPGLIRTNPQGEDYYSFELKNEGTVSVLPHIWIDPDASDEQIGDKLKYVLQEALHPETMPDDLSVPNLQREENGV